MRQITLIDADRIVKYNRTDAQRVTRLLPLMVDGWDVSRPCVVIDRAASLFAVNASHRLDIALRLGIDVPCLVVDEAELGEYNWDSLCDASDILEIMSMAGLDTDIAYLALSAHIESEQI